jgi:hypothetical protein
MYHDLLAHSFLTTSIGLRYTLDTVVVSHLLCFAYDNPSSVFGYPYQVNSQSMFCMGSCPISGHDRLCQKTPPLRYCSAPGHHPQEFKPEDDGRVYKFHRQGAQKNCPANNIVDH